MGWNGVIFLKNFLFLCVGSLEPWMITMYEWWGRISTTVPVLVHLPGFRGLLWSWTTTVSPMERGWSGLAPNWSRSSILLCLLANALSLCSVSILHSFLGLYLDSTAGRWSRNSRPNRIIAGLKPVIGSGVLR